LSMIYVFLNNKLITCDTITPFLYEVCKTHPSLRVRMFTFDDRTYKNICETELLYEAIREHGVLTRFTDHKRVSRHQSFVIRLGFRVRAIFMLIWLMLIAIFNKPVFLHFKALNNWPLRILFLLNKKRTILCEPTTAGVTTVERETDHLIQDRVIDKTSPAASAAIGFSGKWQPPLNQDSSPIPFFYVGRPYLRAMWRGYVSEKACELMQEAGYKKEQRQLVYILSSMDNTNMLHHEETFLALFERTLELLHKVAPGVRILIRRHPATLPEYIDFQDEIIARSVNTNVHVTKWHTSVLCHISCGMIANAYSSTFDIARSLGIETVEFTHYSQDFLNVTNGKSTRPDMTSFFVQNDDDGFAFALKNLLSRADKRKNTSCAITDAKESDVGFKAMSLMLSTTNL